MKSIIIADDHPIFRSGIRSILETMPDVKLTGEADNGATAYELIVSLIPDIAILDLEMPVLSGLEVCKKVLHEKHYTKFIILTMHKDKQYFKEAIESGVHGYLLKDYAIQDLLKCIESVSKDQQYISPQIENYLTEHHTNEQSTEAKRINELLSPTERVVLKLISTGKTSVEIAQLLFVSPNTIDNHRASINKKLNLGGEKNALLKFAIKHGDIL